MTALLDVILPVFLVLGAGYLAAWRGLFSQSAADGLMLFAQRFAVPCLLFSAMANIDLDADFNAGLLISFYTGVGVAFALGAGGALLIFARPPRDCVAIGFTSFFSNSVLLGLPIMERAFGPDALAGNYMLIAFHPPLLYSFGIVAMEIVKAREGGGGRPTAVAAGILRSISSNALIIGIFLGLLVNISGVKLPATVDAALDLIVRAALPAALFALGALLVRYRPEGDMRVIGWVGLNSLILHPAIVFFLGTIVFDLSQAHLRSAVVTAAMAPGVNAYIFANMFGAARRVAASSVLLLTAISVLTVWAWLALLS